MLRQGANATSQVDRVPIDGRVVALQISVNGATPTDELDLGRHANANGDIDEGARGKAGARAGRMRAIGQLMLGNEVSRRCASKKQAYSSDRKNCHNENTHSTTAPWGPLNHRRHQDV